MCIYCTVSNFFNQTDHLTESLSDLISVLHINGTYPTESLYGWIIIHQRLGRELNHHRTWEVYKTGFGSVLSRYSDFLMGLEAMHQLTTRSGANESANFMLRIEVQSQGDNNW